MGKNYQFIKMYHEDGGSPYHAARASQDITKIQRISLAEAIELAESQELHPNILSHVYPKLGVNFPAMHLLELDQYYATIR